jgi:hypothetical protein
MGGELLQTVYHWLPVMFALDLALFQLVADDPLAVRWWWRRTRDANTTVGLA